MELQPGFPVPGFCPSLLYILIIVPVVAFRFHPPKINKILS